MKSPKTKKKVVPKTPPAIGVLRAWLKKNTKKGELLQWSESRDKICFSRAIYAFGYFSYSLPTKKSAGKVGKRV